METLKRIGRFLTQRKSEQLDEEQFKIETLKCDSFGKKDVILAHEVKTVVQLEWVMFIKYNLLFLALLLSICIYDLLTLESKRESTYLFMILIGCLMIILFLLKQFVKPKNTVIFTISIHGITYNEHLYPWESTEVLIYDQKGNQFLILKEQEGPEKLIPMKNLNYFSDRVICWMYQFKQLNQKRGNQAG